MGGISQIPYDEIDTRGDRGWTLRLIARVSEPAASKQERLQAARTLRELDDTRMIAPLQALLLDRSAPEEVRDAASEALVDVDTWTLSPDVLREWWAQGDDCLRRAAIWRMDKRCGDIASAVASNPVHPLHRDAIAALSLGFDEARFQPLKAAALRHPDRNVRIEAPNALVWDEPLVALDPLLDALRDCSGRVARSAAYTLRYYATQRTLRALAPLRESRYAGLREMASESFMDLREDFLQAAVQFPVLRGWMAPVWELLASTPEDLESFDPELPASPCQPHCPPRERVSAAEVRARFDDPDGAWKEKALWSLNIDFEMFDEAERASLADYFTSHPEPTVRQHGCSALEAWNACDHLLMLVDDPHEKVKKFAIYHLGELSSRPDSLVAARAWRRLDEPGLWGRAGQEALKTYDRHATDPEAVPNLLACACDHRMEFVRSDAVYALTKRGAADALRHLIPLLARPPEVTWAVHIALLDACKRLSLQTPPEALATLREVDDLNLQRALAGLAAG